jgi:hypothetical protein
VKQVSHSHLKIAEIKWRRIYTTNYDNVLETSFAQLGKKLTPVTLMDDIRDIDVQTNVCIHLNGYIDRLNRESLGNEFKLTTTAYLTTSLVSSPWATLLRGNIEAAKAVFFIGYSLYDLDIKRLIYGSDDLKNKCFFITAPKPTASLTHVLSKFGQVCPKGLDRFVNRLTEVMSSYSPVVLKEVAYDCFDCVSEPTGPAPEFKDEEFFRLFLYGDVNDHHIYRSLGDKDFLYYLRRPEIDMLVERIDRGLHNILIHSNLGNGKTLLLHGLKYQILRRGFRVVVTKKMGDTFLSEVDHMMQTSAPLAIIIDDYSRYLKAIEEITLRRSANTVLILTCRSLINDVVFDRLCESLQCEDLPEFCINKIREEEAADLVRLFDRYGLWGRRAGWPEHAKIDYILNTCRGEFQLILLDLLNAPWIKERFRAYPNKPEQRNVIMAQTK